MRNEFSFIEIQNFKRTHLKFWKKNFPNNDVQQFFFPNNDGKQFFFPNNDGKQFLP